MSSGASRPLLIQVVPQLKPDRCGISDQAVLLARELERSFGIDSAFVVLNSDERPNLPQTVIHCPPARLLENCLELTQGHGGALLTHVSGYGYSPDGAPTFLADALERVRASGRFRIATYFHEIYAGGWPWTSAFWHARRQKNAARKIIAQCGLVVTNIARHAQWLADESRILGDVRVEQMPVFSPAGEPDTLIPFAQRNAAMVIFGRAETRMSGYRKLAEMPNLLAPLGIREIHDVGPDCHHPVEIEGIPVRRIGLLAADKLANTFSQTQFGFVYHPMYCLAKSSVFAAYCAQGTVSVIAERFPEAADGLQEGLHVVSPRTAEAAQRLGWETCSRAARHWYIQHGVTFHADMYARWMGASGE